MLGKLFVRKANDTTFISCIINYVFFSARYRDKEREKKKKQIYVITCFIYAYKYKYMNMYTFQLFICSFT